MSHYSSSSVYIVGSNLVTSLSKNVGTHVHSRPHKYPPPPFQGIFQNKCPLFMVKQDILNLKPYTYFKHEENGYISKTKFSNI